MPAAVSLSQMVDLSLGTPEIGSVNFNVMHTLLHAIIKKLNISDAKAEINEHDREFLSTSKMRARSNLSDADSGRGEDSFSEDGLSEKSSVPPFRPSPYHRMELKVEKLAQQLEELNKLPSNAELFDRTTKSKSDTSDRPMADMWQYMQLKKRVDANEEGVGKLFSLLEDLSKQMKELKDANKLLEEKIKGLNTDDLRKKLAELEKITSDLSDKFALLPTPEELNQFVTWPALEDALKGIRDDLQPIPPPERVVIEMSSQTDPPSRPGSSRPVSRVSTPGPSEALLDILERLGKLDEAHVTLKERVDALEEELKNKLDKSAVESLGVPAELLEQIQKLKDELDALAATRDKPSISSISVDDDEPSVSTGVNQSSVSDHKRQSSVSDHRSQISVSDKSQGSVSVSSARKGGAIGVMKSVTEEVKKIRMRLDHIDKDVASAKIPVKEDKNKLVAPGQDVRVRSATARMVSKEDLSDDRRPSRAITAECDPKHMTARKSVAFSDTTPKSEENKTFRQCKSDDTKLAKASTTHTSEPTHSIPDAPEVTETDTMSMPETLPSTKTIEDSSDVTDQQIDISIEAEDISETKDADKSSLYHTEESEAVTDIKAARNKGINDTMQDKTPYTDSFSSEEQSKLGNTGSSSTKRHADEDIEESLQTSVKEAAKIYRKSSVPTSRKAVEESHKYVKGDAMKTRPTESVRHSARVSSGTLHSDSRGTLKTDATGKSPPPSTALYQESQTKYSSVTSAEDIDDSAVDSAIYTEASSATVMDLETQKPSSVIVDLATALTGGDDFYFPLMERIDALEYQFDLLQKKLDLDSGFISDKSYHQKEKDQELSDHVVPESRTAGASQQNLDHDAVAVDGSEDIVKKHAQQIKSLQSNVNSMGKESMRMRKIVEQLMAYSKVTKSGGISGAVSMDAENLAKMQFALQQLQAEVEKLHHTTSDIIDDNKHRSQLIEELQKYCDRLQEEKADKDYVQMEVDVKADKKSLDGKVNHKLFDQTTEEINKLIQDILDKLAGHDEGWKNAFNKLMEDIDGKLDRLELDPLKEWLEGRLKALNEKIKKYQVNMDIGDDDAAGIRKQLIQRFHCISCDRPVDMVPTGMSTTEGGPRPVPSLPNQQGLPPSRSPRPYTTFELEQIRQHAKSGTLNRSCENYERALAEQQLAALKKSDLKSYLVHFKRDVLSVAQCATQQTFGNSEVMDYYATPRPCGGSHTLTYPHKRNTKLNHLSHLFREDEAVVLPVNKEEIDVQGVDGHIYRGRTTQKLEARLPTQFQPTTNMSVRASSPHPPPGRPQKTTVTHQSPLVTQQRNRPASARTPPSPRPSSASQGHLPGSRPMSARVQKGQESSQGTPAVPQPSFAEEQTEVGTSSRVEEPAQEAVIQMDTLTTEAVQN